MANKNTSSLAIIVICLLAAGAVLWYSVNQVNQTSNESMPGGLRSPATASAAASTAGVSLHELASRNDLPGLEAAAKAGADVNATSTMPGGREGVTPLMVAAQSGKPDAVRALLQAGASVNARAADGRTPLIFAAGWGNADTVKVLLEGDARVDDRNEDRWTALMMASARGEIGSVKALLDAGADVRARNKWGQTPVMAAARAGDAEKISLLLSAGADPNDRDNNSRTALAIAAATEGGSAAVAALLSGKADPNLSDTDGVTPLMVAADRADIDTIRLLLAAGAKKDAKDSNGRSATDWAAARDDDAGRAAVAALGS